MDNEKVINLGKCVFEFDEDGKVTNIIFDKSFAEVLGYTEEEFSDIRNKQSIGIHPDDKERVFKEYAEAVKKHPEGYDCDIEYRMLTKYGYRWFHDYGHYTRRPDGTAIKVDIVIFDINDSKTMNVNLGAIQLSHDVLSKSNIGLWAMELDPGEPGRLYGDEAMMKLLGVKGKITPEEALSILDDNVDREHWAEVHEALDKMAAGFHAEVQYPWHHPDGRTVIVRCGGIRNPTYTKGIRIEGVHRDITNLTHYDREKELLDQVREQEKVTDIFINTYTLVFKVNLETDSFSVLKRDNVLIRNPKSVIKFSTALNSFLNNVVYEKDRPKVEKEIDYQNIRKRLMDEPAFSFDYRVAKGDVTEWHEMSVKALDENKVAIGIANKDKELILEHLQEKINDEFFALFSVDLDTEKLKMIKSSPWYDMIEEGVSIDYKDAFTTFAENLEGEPKDFFLRLCDINYTKRIFSTEDKRTYSYQTKLLENNPWVTVSEYITSRHEDGTPSSLVLGFSLLDSLGADKQELQIKLKNALFMAQSANRAKTTFLNNMSHDIRTPMNAIIGYTDLAVRHIDDKNQLKDYLGKISHSSDHLLSLINDVLDMSRIESGKMTISTKEESIFEIVETIKDIIQADIHSKKLQFDVNFINVSYENIECDKLRIKQILLNILTNSIKYTPAGGQINFSIEEIIDKKKKLGTFVFIIKDTGMGMSKEFLDRIYEPFTRVKSSTVSGIQGTGLGMSITKSLVEMMDGNITIESEVNKGTEVKIEFVFKLTKKAASSAVKNKKQKVVKTDKTVDFTGKKILLVEDNELNREIATIFLEENGFVITPVEDGSIAVEKINSAKPGDYDLILMDIQMPIMDGYEATKQIRASNSKLKDIPIVAMTANAFEEDKKMAFDVGMNDYLAKPINMEKLKEVLTAILF